MFVSVFNQLPDKVRLTRIRRRYLATSATRRRAIRQFASLSIALGIGWMVHSASARAESVQSAWGPTVSVVMTTRAIRGGDALAKDDLEMRKIPTGMAPESAFSETDTDSDPIASIVGRRVDSPVGAGEILTGSDLARAGRSRTASLVDDGRAAVTLKVPDHQPSVEPGDEVDVYGVAANDEASVNDTDAYGRFGIGSSTPTVGLIQQSARVLEVGSGAVTLVVDVDKVSKVLTASRIDEISLVIRG